MPLPLLFIGVAAAAGVVGAGKSVKAGILWGTDIVKIVKCLENTEFSRHLIGGEGGIRILRFSYSLY